MLMFLYTSKSIIIEALPSPTSQIEFDICVDCSIHKYLQQYFSSIPQIFLYAIEKSDWSFCAQIFLI